MRVPSVRHHLTLSSAATPYEQVAANTTVTVVGDRCVGEADTSLLERSRQLAKAANVGLLGIQFSDPSPEATFLSATLYPEIDSFEVTDAMLQYFS